MQDELALIERARGKQDREAFSALVRLHQGRIRAFLVRLCRDYHRADDLAQDTFIQAWTKLDSFAGKGSFSGWLFQIAYRQFLTMKRKESRLDEVTRLYGEEFALQKDRYVDMTAEQLELEKLLCHLNEVETACVTLNYTYGLSHGEIAEILQMPTGSVKIRIHRSKEKLKKLMAASLAQSKTATNMEQVS